MTTYSDEEIDEAISRVVAAHPDMVERLRLVRTHPFDDVKALRGQNQVDLMRLLVEFPPFKRHVDLLLGDQADPDTVLHIAYRAIMKSIYARLGF